MAQSKHEIQAVLAEAGSQPRHRFGQNFMIDQNLVRLVADAGEIAPGELVIEVGPGTGTLTEELLARGAVVVAVEIDRDLARVLRGRWGRDEATERRRDEGEETERLRDGETVGRFRLIEGDALASKHELNGELVGVMEAWRRAHPGRAVKLVANLPYNIASPLVVELLSAGVELLAFTVQKEVAERLRAREGTGEYGPLTVMVRMLSTVEVLRTLPAQAFWPAPKIESSLVRLRRVDRVGARAKDFSRFVHRMFAARRKTLRKALEVGGYDSKQVLSAAGMNGQVRPEVLPPEAFWRMFEIADAAPAGETEVGGEGRSEA